MNKTITAKHREKRTQTLKILGNIVYAVLIMSMLFFFLLPFYWMVMNSFKTPLGIILSSTSIKF